MSEANIRALLRSKKFENLQVPAGFDKNVGSSTKRIPPATSRPADMSDLEAEVLGRPTAAKFVAEKGTRVDVVEDAGADLVARFLKAQEQLQNKTGKKKTVAGDPLKPLAEHVRTVAREMKGGDGTPTVAADVAAALLAVDESTRDMILRRAGNPPEFAPLRGGGLEEPPQDVASAQLLADARKRVDAEDAEIARASSVERLPMQKRESSHFNLPEKIGKKGNIITPSEQAKNFRIDKQSPLDVKGPVNKDDPLTEKQTRALDRLAGDQIGQVISIGRKPQFKEGGARLPPVVTAKEAPPVLKRTESYPTRRPSAGQSRVLEAAEQSEQTAEALAKAAGVSRSTVRGLLDAGHLDYAGRVDELPREAQISKGVDPNYWNPSDRWEKGRPTADKEIAYRNSSHADNLLRRLYELTAPESALDAGGAPVHLMADNTTTIDMDAMFPWWRARFADMDDKGKIVYPNRLPSAEFITGLMESRLGVTDPGFYDRVLPLVQRSIDAAPDAPSPANTPYGKTALEYSQQVFLPSKSYEAMMKQKVRESASPDTYHPTAADVHIPHMIYGPRVVDRPNVTAPERNPYSRNAAKSQADDARVNELRQLMSEPGLGDQSSIYRMPQHSPMRSLLA